MGSWWKYSYVSMIQLGSSQLFMVDTRHLSVTSSTQGYIQHTLTGRLYELHYNNRSRNQENDLNEKI